MKRLFVAQVAIVIEDKWLNDRSETLRVKKSYAIHNQLFSADDEEAAYLKVMNWLENKSFSDANHDGEGDITEMNALGIYQIEEICSLEDLPGAIEDLYGVSLPVCNMDSKPPTVKDKSDLEIFLMKRFTAGIEGFNSL